jgi:transposase-like protein
VDTAFRYPTPLRVAACERLLAGERSEELADELGRSGATLYRWKKQALIDSGRKPTSRATSPMKWPARKRIKDLQAQLELVKAVSALFNGQVVLPKGSARSSKD